MGWGAGGGLAQIGQGRGAAVMTGKGTRPGPRGCVWWQGKAGSVDSETMDPAGGFLPSATFCATVQLSNYSAIFSC